MMPTPQGLGVRFSYVVAAGLLLAALAACTSDEKPERDEKYAFGEGDQYVALGDSYTAAPRTGPRDGRDGCQRTQNNYPHRVAEATGMVLVDNSCSGANTNSITRPQPTLAGDHPPQAEGLDERTDLVTIRLGANNYSMFGRILRCARFFGSAAKGAPCTDIDAASGPTGIDARLEDIEQDVISGLRVIQERAPNARVLVIGYPHIIPTGTTCELLPLPEGDYEYARRIAEGFNAALEAAADHVGVEFVDIFAATEGHDICADEPWIAGAELLEDTATPWHPYPEESQAVAEEILDELE